MTDSQAPTRDENGRLLPGCTANPEGKNGYLKGWQRYGDRLQHWLAKPPEEIATYFENNGEKLKKLSSIDAVCLQHVSAMLTGEDKHREREAGLDRIEGKPKQVLAHGGDPDNRTPIAMDGTFTLTFGTENNDGDAPADHHPDLPRP